MFKGYLEEDWWVKKALCDIKKTIWRYIVKGDSEYDVCMFCETAGHNVDEDITVSMLCLTCPWVVFKGRACNGLPWRAIQGVQSPGVRPIPIHMKKPFWKTHPLLRIFRLAIWWCRLKWWQLKNRYRR